MSGSTLSINTFDAIVLSILGLSALVAFFRGFIRELLSLGAWVGAALITIYLFPHSTEFMKNHIHGSQSAPVAVAAALLSALSGIPVPEGSVIFGEIGLSGEIRQVGRADARLKESEKLGFRTAIMPVLKNQKPAITAEGLHHVSELLAYFREPARRATASP